MADKTYVTVKGDRPDVTGKRSGGRRAIAKKRQPESGNVRNMEQQRLNYLEQVPSRLLGCSPASVKKLVERMAQRIENLEKERAGCIGSSATASVKVVGDLAAPHNSLWLSTSSTVLQSLINLRRSVDGYPS